MKKVYVAPEELRTKFRSKRDLYRDLTVDHSYFWLTSLHSGTILAQLQVMIPAFYQTVIISNEKSVEHYQ